MKTFGASVHRMGLYLHNALSMKRAALGLPYVKSADTDVVETGFRFTIRESLYAALSLVNKLPRKNRYP